MSAAEFEGMIPAQFRLRWFRNWAIWGAAVGLLIGLGEGSLPLALLWFAGALGYGLRAPDVLNRIAVWLYQRQVRKSEREWTWDPDAADAADHLADEKLSSLDPNRRDWGVLAPGLLVSGVYWGPLAGGFLGALMTDGRIVGPLLGLALGPVLVGLYMTLLTVGFVLYTYRGPRLEGLRPILRAAYREAKSRDEDDGPGHLLLGLLGSPDGFTASCIADIPIDQAVLRNVDSGEFTWEDKSRAFEQGGVEGLRQRMGDVSLESVIGEAVNAARRFKHRSVNGAHLLLALLEHWPERTGRILCDVGLSSEVVRGQVVEVLGGVRSSESA